jgi:intracellular multiplication protein IcmW
MLDLSPEAVKAYWQERHDAALLRIIEAMEAVETWVLDGNPEVEAALTQLVAELNSTPNFDLQNEEELINILSSIKASRALRVLQYIDTLKPGAASKLLIYAEVSSNEPDDLPGFFLKRNLVFERLQLMGRIFSSDRVDLVMKSIDKDET